MCSSIPHLAQPCWTNRDDMTDCMTAKQFIKHVSTQWRRLEWNGSLTVNDFLIGYMDIIEVDRDPHLYARIESYALSGTPIMSMYYIDGHSFEWLPYNATFWIGYSRNVFLNEVSLGDNSWLLGWDKSDLQRSDDFKKELSFGDNPVMALLYFSRRVESVNVEMCWCTYYANTYSSLTKIDQRIP